MNTSELTTYQAVVLQSRAHRAIKSHLAEALRQRGVTMMQWSILGLVADASQNGMRISDLARALDTSLAFVTTSVNVLEAKGFVLRVGHAQDNRAKLVRLSEAFAPQIASIEADLQAKQMRQLYKDISPQDLATYISVLNKIAQAA